jgi:hypothetical protein
MPNYYITELPKTATVAYYYPEEGENLKSEQLEQITKENEIRLMDKLSGDYPNIVALFNHNRSGTMRFLRINGALNETHTKIFLSHMSEVPCKHVSYEVNFDRLDGLEGQVTGNIEYAKRKIDEEYSKEIKMDNLLIFS